MDGAWGNEPSGVGIYHFHKVLLADIRERRHGSDYASIGKEYIQPAVVFYCVVDHGLHRLLVRGVELSDVYVNGRAQ